MPIFNILICFVLIETVLETGDTISDDSKVVRDGPTAALRIFGGPHERSRFSKVPTGIYAFLLETRIALQQSPPCPDEM